MRSPVSGGMIAVSVKNNRKAKLVYPYVFGGEESTGWKEGCEKDQRGQCNLQFPRAYQGQGSILPAQPKPPGVVPASRGQQLGGRVLARAARRRQARGDTHFECGARDSRPSLLVPYPVATARFSPRFGKCVCARTGVAAEGRAHMLGEGERRVSRGSPGEKGRRASAGAGR